MIHVALPEPFSFANIPITASWDLPRDRIQGDASEITVHPYVIAQLLAGDDLLDRLHRVEQSTIARAHELLDALAEALKHSAPDEPPKPRKETCMPYPARSFDSEQSLREAMARTNFYLTGRAQ